jgi:hypothetical protein
MAPASFIKKDWKARWAFTQAACSSAARLRTRPLGSAAAPGFSPVILFLLFEISPLAGIQLRVGGHHHSYFV